MARKAKRKATPRRLVAPSGVTPSTAPAGPDSRVASRPPVRVGGDQALVRAVEMSLNPNVVTRARGRNRFVIEGGDPAIPLDRVPYFTSDLRRIGIVAVVMVALLVAADYVVPALLH